MNQALELGGGAASARWQRGLWQKTSAPFMIKTGRLVACCSQTSWECVAIMTIAAAADLAGILRRYGLLETDQLRELESELLARFAEPRSLARELIQRCWLTPYQINHIFQGRTEELILGQHLLLERLGEGGMGAVFKARHRRLGRIDALKIIRKDRLDNPEAVRRFQREAQAAARLSHPNIVRIFDAGEIHGSHFLVMQYVEGCDLSRLVKQGGPLSIQQACDYVRQAALGLQHAHEQGLVHRDIKPHNLVLTRASSAAAEASDVGLLKVLDMGLARIEQKSNENDSGTLTREGVVMGTVDYLAPEQARNSHRVDIRADLYSLGCTLFYLLTGRVPFPGGTTIEKLLRHQCEEPPALEKTWPDVPPGLADLVRNSWPRSRKTVTRPPRNWPTPWNRSFPPRPWPSGWP